MSVVRRFAAALVALALSAAFSVGVSGCDLGHLTGSGDKGYTTGDGDVIQIPPDQRGAPVQASGTDLSGQPIDLADYRGQTVMVNVWGSWCTDCRVEMPSIVALAQTFAADHSRRIATVGVDIRDNGGPATAAAYARNAQMTFPSFFNPSGSVLLHLSDKLGGPSSVPSTVVLDAQGRLAALVIGPIPGQTSMREVVDQVADGG